MTRPNALDAPTAIDGAINGEDPEDSGPAPSPEPSPRSVGGRYMIIEELGAGGMGRVDLAYDTKLHREVALKVLHPRVSSSVAARGRMLREAQAMAQLSHPNVVPIFDVEVDGEHLHIAMEYVRGQTMNGWLESDPSPDAILQAFREAGRGLLAAHEAGLVHRDFKPNNVMIGDDGRARVMDFGLARGRDADPEAARSGEHEASAISHTSLSASYTIDGTIAGTPLYMAPEQYTDAPIDARADQYAFCVALVYALTGEPPFATSPGSGFAELAKAKRENEAVLPAALPSWLVPALRRGLAAKPDDRWPSMAALLEQLDRDPSAKRQRWLAIGALASSVLVAVAAVVFGPTNNTPAPLCAGAEQHLEPIWSADRRARVEQAVLATQLRYAPAVWTAISTNLDTYAAAWIGARVEVCEATRIRGEQSEAMLDQRMHCLDRRLDELDALVEVLTTADAELVDQAATAVAGLEPMSSCDAAVVLDRRALPTDEEARTQLAAASKATAHAKALVDAGKLREGAAAADEAEAYAARLGFPWLEAEAALLGATAKISVGEFAEARAALQRVVLVSDRAGEDRIRATALAQLMRNAMHQEGDREAAERYGEAALAVLERLGSPPDVELEYIGARAVALAEQGRGDEALALLERGRELATRHELPAEEVNLNYAATLIANGRHREALAINEALLAQLEAELGPDHPRLSDLLTNVAASLQALGEHDRALAVSERLVTLLEGAKGPHSPDLADAYNNRAVVYGLLRRHDDAAADYQRTLEIWTAIAPQNPRRGVAMFNLAETHLHRHRPEDALILLDEASALFQASLPPGHPYNAFVQGNRGWALLELGRHAEALAELEPALKLIHDSGIDALSEAQVQLLLGEALDHTGEAARARELVAAAKITIDELGATYWSERAQRWLDAHAQPG